MPRRPLKLARREPKADDSGTVIVTIVLRDRDPKSGLYKNKRGNLMRVLSFKDARVSEVARAIESLADADTA